MQKLWTGLIKLRKPILVIANFLVGFTPLKRAEFVIIKLQQIADQVEA